MTMQSWKNIDSTSDFSIYNLPFGVYSLKGKGQKKLASAIGDEIIDLEKAAFAGIFNDLNIPMTLWRENTLNNFISLGKEKTSAVRSILQKELCDEQSELKDVDDVFIPMSDVTMHMPVHVGDYTDFYSSEEHATNLGIMFRGPDNALMPNWKHLPVGYHGRASSIIPSGIPIHRPKGQQKPNDGPPVFGPTKRLDIELEVAFVVGKDTTLGNSISTEAAEDYIFGLCLFNDWSARDIQKWEYVPLGPFLGKSFASSISPWIVTLEALDTFRVEGPKQEPEVLDYLKYDGKKNYDINLAVDLIPKGGSPNRISNSNFKYMYWNMSQQLAHHTVNGCNVCVGDMMASGTISGKDEQSYGSLLEITKSGKNPLKLNTGETRTFLEDGDTIVMTGYCEKDGKRVGFGEVRTEILPAK